MQLGLSDAPRHLPLFNPDLEASLRPDCAQGRAVDGWNAEVRDADALLVACPEYARGVPGAFKNALDWLVGTDAFIEKPFVLFNASPRAHHAQDALRITLETMSGILVERACVAVPLLNRRLDAEAILADPHLAGPVRAALAALSAFIDARPC